MSSSTDVRLIASTDLVPAACAEVWPRSAFGPHLRPHDFDAVLVLDGDPSSVGGDSLTVLSPDDAQLTNFLDHAHHV